MLSGTGPRPLQPLLCKNAASSDMSSACCCGSAAAALCLLRLLALLVAVDQRVAAVATLRLQIDGRATLH